MPKFVDLKTDGCRYPLTEDTPFVFCGRQQQPGKSYCPKHHTICVTGAARPLEFYADVINARDGIVRKRAQRERTEELDVELK